MKLQSMLSKLAVVALAAVVCVSFTGCGAKNGYTGGVAATINGVDIDEDKVTKYIQDFRKSSSLESDEAWAAWLKESDQTPQTIREQVIDYYVQQELVKKAAEEQQISVDPAQVDEQVNAMKKNYNNDQAWAEALAQSGVTEDQYRESIAMGLTSRELQKAVVQEVDTSDDAALLKFMNTYKDMIKGSKRSSHILLPATEEAKANEIATQLTEGKIEFAAAAQQYSTDTGSARNGGDVGWNTINNFVEAYNTALDSLSKGQITITASDYGIHIILCTDVLEIDGEPDSLSAYPTEIVEYMRSIFGTQKQSEDFQAWLKKLKEESDLVINEMPSNVPYNIDLSKFNTETEGTEEGNGENTPGQDNGESSNLSAIDANG